MYVCPKSCFGHTYKVSAFTVNVISSIVYFRDIGLESSLNVSEATFQMHRLLHYRPSDVIWPVEFWSPLMADGTKP